MKILIPVSYIDLHYRIGCTPAFWQLFKGLYELGHEIIVTPYAGKSIESLWWRDYPNPAFFEFKMFTAIRKFLPKRKKKKKVEKDSFFVRFLTRNFVARKWRKHLKSIFDKEGEFDIILITNLPLNHLTNIGRDIEKMTSAPIIYYNGDMPVHLPKYGGFQSGVVTLLGADLSQFDLVVTNSEGVYEDLKELGAEKIETLHWGVDPDLYKPVNKKKIFDAFFFGFGREFREKWIEEMLVNPSMENPNLNFLLGGWGLEKNIGKCQLEPDIPFSLWRIRCAQSKINLSISRASHALVDGTSASRPFELASLECCTVSNPHNGIEKWFEVGKELFVVNNKDEIKEVYDLLLSDSELRLKTGKLARARVLKEHTHKHRASELERMMNTLR